MKKAVNAVLVCGTMNYRASREFAVPLETLRRKVNIAKNGVGVEKNTTKYQLRCSRGPSYDFNFESTTEYQLCR